MQPPMGKADLHIHTLHSDGSDNVEAVLQHVVQKTDLNVIAITDHDTVAGALEARRLASKYGIEVIIGAEISTIQGHVLALFIERCVPPGLSIEATITQIHAQGGLCIAAHPYGLLVPSIGRRGWLRQHAPIAHLGLNGMECINASLWNQYNNMIALQRACSLDIALCGGSDAHHAATIGSGFTRFPGHTAADLRKAIEQRLTEPGGSFWGWKQVAIAAIPFLRRELQSLMRHKSKPKLYVTSTAHQRR